MIVTFVRIRMGVLRGSPGRLITLLVKADPSYSSSLQGQQLLSVLINLLARQYGVVGTILLDVENVPMQVGAILDSRLTLGGLANTLLRIGDQVGGDLTHTQLRGNGLPPDVVLLVGPGLDPAGFRVPCVAVVGSGWKATVRTDGPIAAEPMLSSIPFGPHFAACLAAGFAFKAAFGKHRPTKGENNLWIAQGEVAPEIEGVSLPDAYVLGLGAVGAAFGFELASCRGVSGNLVAIDPQTMSDTDRNRLLSGTWDDVTTPKTELFKSLFESSPIDVMTFKGRWPDDYMDDPSRVIPEGLRTEERAGRFGWVICCVDRDRDRSAIAAQLPSHVFAGSTLGMAAQSAYYSVSGPNECLGCRHRTPLQLGVEDLAETLKGMSRDQRQVWYERFGASALERASIEEYLTTPSCAGLGEADLARLGLQGPVDWAVGFVSMAAGVLLASRFIRAVISGVAADIALGSEVRFLFWADELRTTRAIRSVDCPYCAHG